MDENNLVPPIVDARITDIRFSVATDDEISTSSISGCSISHPGQLTNPFLGLPLESGKCESCGTAEPGKCDGHFGYIEFPIKIYHPCHVSELKRLLSTVCLKCLRLKRTKIRQNVGSDRPSNIPCSFCLDIPQILVNEFKTTDGVVFLELKVVTRSIPHNGFWNFLDKYGYRYGEGKSRILLPCEVLEILNKFSEDTRKKLSGKGYFSQDGYILQKLPVPPNCLSIPEISDGISVMSSDISVSILRKVLKQVEIIKSSRSGHPNFESHKVEVNDLQSTVAEYFLARGTAKDSRDIKMSGIRKEVGGYATKAWFEKMKTFFISKGSGYSSRSVITGDAYKRVNEIGLPLEIAQRITFEEKVTEQNKVHLQQLVDKKLCLTYSDGASMYSLREGSKGHTILRVGQVVHRRIMDGDVVFINRPPSTHKHSLQALSVYVHEDHTVKINPLICGPLGADFDGDCIHIFYPQSLAARAEVLELFSVEQQLLSSHTGSLNLQLANDALLSLKIMFKNFFFDKATAQQLAMFVSTNLPQPALLKAFSVGSQWTALQILQSVFPDHFDSLGERYIVNQGEILKFDFNRDMVESLFNEIISSVFLDNGSKEALNVFNSVQPLLMENLFLEGYSVCLKDFSVPKSFFEDLPMSIQEISSLLHRLRSRHNELVELQVRNHLTSVKAPAVNFLLKLSGLGNLIDSKSESSISKVVEQIGFLGIQLVDRGKFYSRNLVEDMTSLFLRKFADGGVEYPSEAFGLIKSCFFHGLNPYEDLVHSICSREVLVRSSRGLTEPGTLFKNLMTVLRDVVLCYDGTVRNVCSNSIIQFSYEVESGLNGHRFYPPGEPVGALAATAISNPSYKVVLDSSSSSNASWELMKEILFLKINFINDLNDRRVILYLKDCGCVKKYCKENAAYLIQNLLKRVSLRDITVNFQIEYQRTSPEGSGTNANLVGHIHLDKKLLKDMNRSLQEVLQNCHETISFFRRRKKNSLGGFLKNISLSVSECCCLEQSNDTEWCKSCLQFSWRLDISSLSLETTSQIMANMICPILLDTIIKGDCRVQEANIIWSSPDTTNWVKTHSRAQHGELALEIVLEKKFVKQHGDAWRLALDSCLPVIHLIDTARSIPYGIRQVQELLGISCAFDQAVLRLSSSIRKVNKGVLKKHLLLAANSMTCTGSLIGFNKAGYKALFRSLDVHIPFTEATLFTPRKCFERAAEKCHADALSGIVASCSWGKHVALGTGTPFEILWNKNEMGLDQDGVIDVYDFLQLVRMDPIGDLNTSCLGRDTDELIENGVAELSLSPERNFDYSKPTFDDAELQCKFDEHQVGDQGNTGDSRWEMDTSVVKDGGSSDWDAVKPGGSSDWSVVKAGGSSDWGTVKAVGSSDWGAENAFTESKPSDWGATAVKAGGSSDWGAVKSGGSSDWGGENAFTGSKPSDWGATADKFQKQLCLSTEPSEGGPAAGWNAVGSQKLPSKETVDTWGKQDEKSDTNDWVKHVKSQWEKEACDGGPASGWNASESQKLHSNEPFDAWGKQAGKSNTDGWVKNIESQRGQPNESRESESSKSTGWNTIKSSSESPRTSNWNSLESQETPQMEPSDPWGKKTEETKAGGWSGNDRHAQGVQWNKSPNMNTNSSQEEVNQNANPLNSDGPSSTNWTKVGQTQDEQKRDLPWGPSMMHDQGKKPSGPRGWGSSNSGEWKLKNRPAKSPGKWDEWNGSGNLTATRQRLDQFTSEEQQILSDVEPVIQALQRIMRQPGYKDGNPLSPDDQSYVLENAFNYHPDKAVKMGAGVDYVMIDKNSKYPDSRCYHIVSTDGRRDDFSYRKCVENFIKEKYPEMAEAFISKYFRKPNPRGGHGQEQSSSQH
ncbi:hypothetical protein IFM89_039671 [Coptis chinensis]|uniref:DNA-directed RNA polymerase n=1 Tax=Coptis chinensis TaxID=261450 RepID=A0A835LH34_9MAGN|nr:hypothetical protein IFM89_039671 [Coptis chinensis]